MAGEHLVLLHRAGMRAKRHAVEAGVPVLRSTEASDDVDALVAQARLEARQQALKAFNDKSAELDYTRAAAELAEAVAQLRTIQQLRKKAGKG